MIFAKLSLWEGSCGIGYVTNLVLLGTTMVSVKPEDI